MMRRGGAMRTIRADGSGLGGGNGTTVFSPNMINGCHAWYRPDLNIGLIQTPLLANNNFVDVAWTPAGVTFTDSQPDPFGGNTAWTMTNDTSNTSHTITQVVSGLQNNGYTEVSLYAKAGTANYVQIGGNASTPAQVFNLSNGTLGASNPAGLMTAQIFPMNGGWYQCVVRFNASNTTVWISINESDAIGSYVGTTKTITIYKAGLLHERVNLWQNQGPSTYDMTQNATAYQPIFRHAGNSPFAGKPTIRGDGTADRLPTSGPLADWRFLHDGTGCSIYMVVRTPASILNGYLVDSSGGLETNHGLSIESTNVSSNMRFKVVNGTTAVFLYEGAPATINTSYQIILTHSTAAGYSIRRNSIPIASAAYAAAAGNADSAGNPTLFSTPGGSGFCNWMFAEIGFYKKVLVQDEIDELEAYGKAYYGLP